MSHPDVNRVIDTIPGRRVPTVLAIGGPVAAVLGVVCFGYGMMIDPAWAWGAFLVGLLYTFAIAQGGVMFSVVGTLTWARWSRPLKRVAESFGWWLPFAYLALVFFLLAGGTQIYPWNPATIVGKPIDLLSHNPAVVDSKPMWLSKGFFTLRLLVGVGFMLTLDAIYLRASMRPDMLQSQARLGDKAPGWWKMITGGAGTLQAEIDKGQNTQSTLGPILGFTYAFIVSLVAFDLIMSLSPLWYSNLFGAWIFTNSFWLSMAWLAFISLTLRDWLGLGEWIKPKVMHDLGKLILAYTMAYGYMLFGQLLPIWYANEPEETQFLMVRLFLPQWSWMAHIVAVMCFIAPFILLTSRGIKKMRWPFVGLVSIIMIGVFFDRTLLVMPSVHLGDDFPMANFLIVSVGIWIGFLGGFVTVVSRVLASVPTLVVSDPKLDEHPWDAHVHSLDAHHAAEH